MGSDIDIAIWRGQHWKSTPGGTMRPALIFVALVSLFLLTTTSVIAKNATIEIYAVIDKVTFEPGDSSPAFVRISGVFVVPVPMSSGKYGSPQRGYLYFRIPPGREVQALKDWKELNVLAGTGRVVGFADYWVPNPSDPQGNPHHSLEVTVHTAPDDASPGLYPLSNLRGIVTAGDKADPAFDSIATQLRETLRPQSSIK